MSYYQKSVAAVEEEEEEAVRHESVFDKRELLLGECYRC
jgi:hypothetical protein